MACQKNGEEPQYDADSTTFNAHGQINEDARQSMHQENVGYMQMPLQSQYGASFVNPYAAMPQYAACPPQYATQNLNGAFTSSGAYGIAQPIATSTQPQQPAMPILLGTYTPKIDAKGRVALPAKFRTHLGNGFVMSRGQEHCVYILPMTEFQRMTIQIQHASMSNKSARDYLRVFLSGAVDQQPDKQGRIVVPPMLREYAHLSSSIVVIGVGTRAEIWDQQTWETYLAEREPEYADIADDVLPAVRW